MSQKQRQRSLMPLMRMPSHSPQARPRERGGRWVKIGRCPTWHLCSPESEGLLPFCAHLPDAAILDPALKRTQTHCTHPLAPEAPHTRPERPDGACGAPCACWGRATQLLPLTFVTSVCATPVSGLSICLHDATLAYNKNMLFFFF